MFEHLVLVDALVVDLALVLHGLHGLLVRTDVVVHIVGGHAGGLVDALEGHQVLRRLFRVVAAVLLLLLLVQLQQLENLLLLDGFTVVGFVPAVEVVFLGVELEGDFIAELDLDVQEVALLQPGHHRRRQQVAVLDHLLHGESVHVQLSRHVLELLYQLLTDFDFVHQQKLQNQKYIHGVQHDFYRFLVEIVGSIQKFDLLTYFSI